MPKVSRDSASKIQDFPAAYGRSEDLLGYTVDFMSTRESVDLRPALSMLPAGHCVCPHWGYVFAGRLTFVYDDREEVFEAGDAFYTPPGHAPIAEAGTEILMFSPTEELAETDAAITRAMTAMQEAQAAPAGADGRG